MLHVQDGKSVRWGRVGNFDQDKREQIRLRVQQMVNIPFQARETRMKNPGLR